MTTKLVSSLLIVPLLAVVGLLLPLLASAAELIKQYDVELTVRADATLSVQETITYDFGSAERRGIFRTLPELHHQQPEHPLQRRTLEYEIDEVLRDGNQEPYTTYTESGSQVIRIGNADVTISGPHTYVIDYTVTGGLSYYENEPPELFWDAIGGDWSVPIKEAVVTLNDPDGIFLEAVSCYSGSYGATNGCEQLTPNQFRVSNLGAGEGVTIAQSLQTDAVATVTVTRWNLFSILFYVFVLLLLSGIYLIYRFKTYHDPHRTVIPQYEPHPGVLPMYTGLLRDGRLDSRDITAGILYLAQQGYISIEKTEEKILLLFNADDFELTLQKNSEELDSEFLKQVLLLLFGHEVHAPNFQLFGSAVKAYLADPSKDYKPTNMAVGKSVRLSELKKNSAAQRKNVVTRSALKKSLRKDLIAQRYFENPLSVPGALKNLSLSSVPVIVGIFVFGTLGAIMFVPLVFVVIVLVAVMHRRRTRKGYEALNHLKGFAEFLSVTGEERFKFNNAPDKNPQTFLEYLPYAVALGVEKEWAEVFKDITIPEPGWYHSSTGVHTFAATDLTKSLGAFSTALATSTSSSGSSSSGSSSGGFSGGGSGGGGGGSW